MTILPFKDDILSSIKVYHNKPESKMKKMRKKRKLTQQQLANRTRISVSLIGHYEQGSREIPENRKKIIAKALGCDPSEI